ncbi:MAG: SIMPL domain-containing protein [Flavobacteriales bacterium]|nr:SIMPL domain-containing protein [Flavobacteriales bacterium]
MNTFKTVLVLFLASSYSLSFAQSPTWVQQDPKPFIEVTGKAIKEVVPDEIYISITLKERLDGKNDVTIKEKEAALKEAIKGIGIDVKNLSVSDANARYARVSIVKKDVVNKAEYTLMVTNAATVSKVFQELDKLKIKNAYVARVDHSKIREYKKEMRIDAIKAAKDKAQYLVAAIDEKIGTPLVIREQFVDNYRPYESQVRYTSNVASYGGSLSTDKAVQWEKIEVQATIYVKFEIE